MLGHGWRPGYLLGGLLISAGAIFAASRGWAQAPRKVRTPTGVISAVLLAAFVIGTVNNPVFIDGKLYLSSSSTVKKSNFAVHLRNDLYTMRDLDALLALSTEDAWAKQSQLEPGRSKALAIGTRYSGMLDAGTVPDEAFVAAARDAEAAAFSEAKALQDKESLVKQDDASIADDLATSRADFANSLIASGQELGDAADKLNIPLNTQQTGPKE